MAAAPEVEPLILVRGDTFDLGLTFWADPDKTVPYPLDDTESIAAEIRRDTGSPVLATFTVTMPASNQIHLNLDAEASALLPYGSTRLGWDVQATWAGPVVHTLAKGKITVDGDITDSEGAVPVARRVG